MFLVENGLAGANIPRTIRFTGPLYSDLNKLAAEAGVSLNALVLQCCQMCIRDSPLSLKECAR